MTERVVFDTFTIERTIGAPKDRVFEALANPEVKARWFVGPSSWKEVARKFDFRVGGHEHVSGKHEHFSSVFDAHYLDIVKNERIVYAYEMTINGRKISASLATFEFIADGQKTKLVLTEQGAYFDDPDAPKYPSGDAAKSRRDGTEALMDQIARVFSK